MITAMVCEETEGYATSAQFGRYFKVLEFSSNEALFLLGGGGVWLGGRWNKIVKGRERQREKLTNTCSLLLSRGAVERQLEVPALRLRKQEQLPCQRIPCTCSSR